MPNLILSAPARARRHGLVLCSALLLALVATGCRNDMHDQPRYDPLERSTFFADSQASRPLIGGTVPRGGLRIDQQMYAGRTGTMAGQAGQRQTGQSQTTQTGSGAPSQGQTLQNTGTGAFDTARGGGQRSPGVTVNQGGSNSGAVVGNPPQGTAGSDPAMRGYTTEFPFAVTRDVLRRGESRFNIYCSPCHGRTGTGGGMIVQRGFKAPPSFHEARLQAAPAGYIFDVITNGFGVMYPYGSRIAPEDRWTIVAYIRALQLSQNASVRDLSAEDQQNLERMMK